MKPLLGVDLGGSKILTGVISPEGKPLGGVIKVPTQAEKPREEVERNIVSAISQAINSAGLSVDSLQGIGIGSPGPLDVKEGVILNPANLPTMHNYPLKRVLEERFGCPVVLGNDADCFTLGECYFGAARDRGIVCGITLGTGLGCGIVIDRKIYLGATGTAAEVWCSPYQEGIFEDYLSGRGIKRLYHQRSNRRASPREIERMAQEGDGEALRAWEDFGRHLGVLIAYIVNLIDPEVVVLGGSISNAYGLFKDTMQETLMANINPKPRERVEVLKSKLGEMAGVMGAAALLLESPS